MQQDTWKNKLYFGDNLDVLRKHIKDESIDLCYIDPPFNSNRGHNLIYNNAWQDDRAQNQAFIDTWEWNERAREGLNEILENKRGRYTSKTIELIKGLRNFLNEGSLLAYLVSMTLRVTEIHRVLKQAGSFYLHCDSTSSHYLKLILDGIFCAQGGDYRNEIVWKRTSAHSDSKTCGRAHDTIFLYTKSDEFIWNKQYQPYAEEYKARFRNIAPDGRRWADYDLTAKGLNGGGYDYEYKGVRSLWRCPIETMERLDREDRLHFTKKGGIRLKRYLEDLPGLPLQDVWDDIPAINSQAKERLGYPTQKPEALLERIIKASSNEGDVILDAYCGCGTTVSVAQKLNRQWIGIDITYQSISIILNRLESSLESIILDGIPKDMASATALAQKKDDRVRKEFEKWAILTYSNNRAIINEKKGADGGVDGVMYFRVNGTDDEKMIFQVKSGHVSERDIRDLRGTMEQERAQLGAFITLQEPTSRMIKAAHRAGDYHHDLMGRSYNKIQIVTVKDIVERGVKLDLPLARNPVKSAQRPVKGIQLELQPKAVQLELG